MFNYWFTTEFAIPIFGLPRYCNVPRPNMVVTKTVILYSVILSQKTFSLHDNLSTENITLFTWGSKKSIEWCN